MTGERRIVGRRDSVWRVYFEGRELGIPRCCCLRYAWGEIRSEGARDQAIERGVALSALGWEHVPCGILHRPTFTAPEYAKVPDEAEAQV